jgi:CheY-like chemotaxis protein/predicted regulator of Ras-like GTPase activity (Roadblock/LC7/MglB family)
MAKVLVVDDSVSVRKVVERALAARHFEVLLAGTAEEAIQRIDADQPDLVICDVILPDKDGYHICEHVRRHPRLNAMPVLLISGIVNSSVLQRAAEVHSSDVMFKPFAADDLVRKIDELLEQARAPRVEAAKPEPTPAPRVDVAAAPAREWAPPVDVKGCLDQLVTMGGVHGAVLADRDGLVIEAAGDLELPAEVAAALAGCLAESSDGLGRELGRGGLTGMILEYESGTLILHVVASSAMLAVLVEGSTVLGKVRYHAKKALPELARALSSEVLACRA